jgi:hypothetical protein
MKYLRLFETEAAYNAAKDNLDLPNVSAIKDKPNWCAYKIAGGEVGGVVVPDNDILFISNTYYPNEGKQLQSIFDTLIDKCASQYKNNINKINIYVALDKSDEYYGIVRYMLTTLSDESINGEISILSTPEFNYLSKIKSKIYGWDENGNDVEYIGLLYGIEFEQGNSYSWETESEYLYQEARFYIQFNQNGSDDINHTMKTMHLKDQNSDIIYWYDKATDAPA